MSPSEGSLRAEAYGDDLPTEQPVPLTKQRAEELLKAALQAEQEVRKAQRAERVAEDEAKRARVACLNAIPSGRYCVSLYRDGDFVEYIVELDEGETFTSSALDSLEERLADEKKA